MPAADDDTVSLAGSTLAESEHESKTLPTTKPLKPPVTQIWRGDPERKEKQMGGEENQARSEVKQVGRNVVYDSGYNGIEGVPGAQDQHFDNKTTGTCHLCSWLYLQA